MAKAKQKIHWADKISDSQASVVFPILSGPGKQECMMGKAIQGSWLSFPSSSSINFLLGVSSTLAEHVDVTSTHRHQALAQVLHVSLVTFTVLLTQYWQNALHIELTRRMCREHTERFHGQCVCNDDASSCVANVQVFIDHIQSSDLCSWKINYRQMLGDFRSFKVSEHPMCGSSCKCKDKVLLIWKQFEETGKWVSTKRFWQKDDILKRFL